MGGGLMATAEERLAHLEFRLNELAAENEKLRKKVYRWGVNGLDGMLADSQGWLNFGNGIMRIDQFGIQMKSDILTSPTRQFWLVGDELSRDPTTLYPRGRFGGNYSGFTSGIETAWERASSDQVARTKHYADEDNVLNGYVPMIIEQFVEATDGVTPESGTVELRATSGKSVYTITVDEFVVSAGTVTGVGGGMELVVQESDQTSTTTTLANTELTFAVAANEVWQFEGVMVLNVPSAADLKMAATGPTGAVGSVAVEYYDTTGLVGTDADALGNELAAIGASGRIARFWGGIHNGANAGSLTIQFAQFAASGTSTLFAGSYIKYQQQ